MDKTVEAVVRLSAPLQERLERLAALLNLSMGQVIEQAVESFVEREDIRRAISEADAGDFASEEEVDAVFAKWRSHAADGG